MRSAIRTLSILLCLAVGPGLSVVSCTSLTGKTAGQNVDDATLTATVKSKLAGERMSSLTRIDVDTDLGTVYLNGTVESAATKDRAEQVAKQVSGVRKVVNNLQVQVGSD
jgi:hyperosmotically inducible periplasmic protein